MKKDIQVPPCEGVEIVVSPRPNETNEANEELWDVWLINHNDYPLVNVLISSRGYGELEGREKMTATLRHFHERVHPFSTIRVEPIQTAVFGITNEYWLSYNHAGQMLEKKFIFEPNTIATAALRPVEHFDRAAVVS